MGGSQRKLGREEEFPRVYGPSRRGGLFIRGPSYEMSSKSGKGRTPLRAGDGRMILKGEESANLYREGYIFKKNGGKHGLRGWF